MTHRNTVIPDPSVLPADHSVFKRISLLTGLAVSTECGLPMQQNLSSGDDLYYQCAGPVGQNGRTPRGRTAAWCGEHRINAGLADRVAWLEYLEQRLSRPRRIRDPHEKRALLLHDFAILRINTNRVGTLVADWISWRDLAHLAYGTALSRLIAASGRNDQ